MSVAAASRPTVVYYWIPTDDDEQDSPNAFEVLQRDAGGVKLRDVRARFPLPGRYHFRFRMKWDSGYVWMDVTNEDSMVPISESGIFAKVLRLSWNNGAPSSVPSKLPAPSSVPSRQSAAVGGLPAAFGEALPAAFGAAAPGGMPASFAAAVAPAQRGMPATFPAATAPVSASAPPPPPPPPVTTEKPMIPSAPAPKPQEDMLHFGDSPLALHAVPRLDLGNELLGSSQNAPARAAAKAVPASSESTDLTGTATPTDFDMLFS